MTERGLFILITWKLPLTTLATAFSIFPAVHKQGRCYALISSDTTVIGVSVTLSLDRGRYHFIWAVVRGRRVAKYGELVTHSS
jgi:hypothetical protein